jgi:hypothetical protein
MSRCSYSAFSNFKYSFDDTGPGGNVVIADAGYWKRVEMTNMDYSFIQEKVVLYRCSPGNCMGSA